MSRRAGGCPRSCWTTSRSQLRADADTIFAVASGAGRAAIAVVRVSGDGAGALLGRLCRRVPPPRRASLRTLRDEGGEVLDRAVVLWFPAPGSYTGENAAEFHLHGGPAVVAGVCEALVAFGARPAEPGEFTRRAFLNGRMDLLEAEAVADLVEAESSAQRRQALRQLDGALGALYRGWAERLTHLCAQQEALIDFPDEDLPDGQEAAMLAAMDAVLAEIERHLDDDRRGERLREGLVFAIAGAPNVGKSTLINALAERDVAIVAPSAGTTRDVLEARAVFGGVPVTLLDTAGLRASNDPIESEGVRRARARAAAADLVVLVRHAADAWNPRDGRGPPARGGKQDRSWQTRSRRRCGCQRADRPRDGRRCAGGWARSRGPDESPPAPAALTRPRHRAALLGVARALRRARGASQPELRGEDFRTALLRIRPHHRPDRRRAGAGFGVRPVLYRKMRGRGAGGGCAEFDVIVIGGGHAGCEAAAAAARVGATTVLLTASRATIGAMSCNPAIGGIGKGHLVREIDALDGLMARAADTAGIHFKLLNRSKGPRSAARARRPIARSIGRRCRTCLRRSRDCASSKRRRKGLRSALMASLAGVELDDGSVLACGAVVLTTGTFLRGSIHIGGDSVPAGRIGEAPAVGLAQSLERLGLPLGRLKTGTPPRLDRREHRLGWPAGRSRRRRAGTIQHS